MIKKLSRWFLRGLIAVLPIAITLAILFWLGSVAEATLGMIIDWLLPTGWYQPGMGLIAGLIFILGVGILLNAYFFRKFAILFERTMDKIPLVRPIYNSIKDIAHFATSSQEEDGLKKAVMVKFGNMKLIGFVTRKPIGLGKEKDLVAVYFPMSYQIGGYTAMLPESELEPLDISTQEAMRLVLTAAMTKPEQTKSQPLNTQPVNDKVNI